MAQQDVNLKDDSRPPRARLKEIPRWDEEYKVIEAARNGDLEELKRLKQTGYNFNVVNWDGDTAIHRAAYKGHLKCVQWLLDNTTIPVDHRNKRIRREEWSWSATPPG
ncbi:cyclin-dependent kinase 4 inhibitor C-like isoform X2 [Dysidea avara]|uniref:cyclin-dependent kinase 4 inhibitor C-like isoform X2 n=1 Tax=Dysidea avara TaxID=196820 RepID=UPI00332D366C